MFMILNTLNQKSPKNPEIKWYLHVIVLLMFSSLKKKKKLKGKYSTKQIDQHTTPEKYFFSLVKRIFYLLGLNLCKNMFTNYLSSL